MVAPTRPRPVVAVIGTTGVGKSQLAVSLAQSLASSSSSPLSSSPGADTLAIPRSGVILSADSMQLYKGLDVITNKVTEEEKGGVEHWGLDIVQMGQGGSWEMGKWCSEADKRVGEMPDDALPIVCGGTHYFIQHFLFPPPELSFDRRPEKAVVDDFKPLDIRWKPPRPRPDVDAVALLSPEQTALLDTFWTEAPRWPARVGVSGSTVTDPGPSRSRPTTTEEGHLLSLYELLQAVDPNEAGRWHWKDGRKVRRGLERWWERGGGDVRASATGGDDAVGGGGRKARFRTLIFWVYEPVETLKPRLERRVDKMVENGLLREIAEMRKVALGIYGSPATIDHTEGIFQSIGYKEFAQLDLDQGNPTTDAKYAQALAQTKSRTYQYAKSQLKWIRKQLLPVVTEARALGGEVFVYAVPGGAGGEGPARRVLDAFLAGEAMPDWKESGHADAEALLREVYDPKAAEQKLPDTAARQVINARRICAVCSDPGKPYSIGVAEWDEHLHSKVHKKAVWRKEGGKERDRAERLAGRDAIRAERERVRQEKEKERAALESMADGPS